MLHALADRLRPRSIPDISRRNFRYEFVSVGFMAAGLACVDVKILGVLADKAFHAGPYIITLIAASDAIANVSSLIWTRYLHGTDRVRSANILQFATIACVLLIAAAPFSPLGILMLALVALAARTFVTGIINARTDLWRANYPRHIRGRVIARLTTLGTFIIASMGLLVALSMDLSPSLLQTLRISWLEGHGFRAVYLFAALAACLGARAFSRVRWRGRAVQLKAERTGRAKGAAHAAGVRNMIRVLKEDKDYRRFMIAQFILGAPNLAAEPIFILSLKPLDLGYTQSMALTRIIPILVPMLVVTLWGRLLDRMHIIRFRSYHSWLFVIANILMAFAFIEHSLPLLYTSRIVLGIAFGGGLLAWELGHHDFAKRDAAAIYMGIHVTLTGIRGIFAPFIGTFIFQPASLAFIAPGLTYPGLGAATFFLLAFISAIGALLFLRLHFNTRHRTNQRPRHD